jgi:hypothetical protein
MRAASARPMPGRRSSSSRVARLMETRACAKPSVETGAGGSLSPRAAARRGSLTQAKVDARSAAQSRERVRKRLRRTGQNHSLQRVWKDCRDCVQNARSLNFSGTCNAKNRFIHRFFHRICGKVVETLFLSQAPSVWRKIRQENERADKRGRMTDEI